MVITNKLGITDESQLRIAEERIEKLRAREMFDKGLLDILEVGTFAGLAAIHRHLYSDIYDFAGEKRTVEVSKGNVRFTSVDSLSTGIGFADIMPIDSFEDIVDKYIEMNIVHPFRTGNGIALRLWLNIILKNKLGMVIDYSAIQKDAFNGAMKISSVDDEKLYALLNAALTKDLGRDMFLRGVDSSFAYEGLSVFKTAELL